MALRDTVKDTHIEAYIKSLADYNETSPLTEFAKLYKSFVENFPVSEGTIVEVDFIAQEYEDKYNKKLSGTLADITSLIQILALNPDAVFDSPSAFQNATRLSLGLSPNYEEALYTPSYQFAEAYVMLNYILKVGHELSPLSPEVADMIAIAVHKDGSNYFPDKRVSTVGLMELISGDNTIARHKLKRINELYEDEVLPAIYASSTKEEFSKKLTKILTEDNGHKHSLLYHTLPMMLLTASTYFQVKDALTK